MANAAAIVEYPYAWIAVESQEFIRKSFTVNSHFHLAASFIMVALGILNVWSSVKPSKIGQRVQENGFRIGILLGILNPLAIPFWLAMTAYIKSHGWINLEGSLELHAYLFGVFLGTLLALMLFAYLAGKVVSQFRTNRFVHRAPGALLIILGVYSFGEYILA